MSAAWLVPTARAMPWQPLAAVSARPWSESAPSRRTPTAGRSACWVWPRPVLAAAVVAGLHDPAAALLSAVPTSAARRRARRLVLLLPVALLIWLAYVAVGHHWYPGLGWPLGQVTALTTTGLALAAWWPGGPDRRAVGAGVAAVLLWYAVAPAGPGRRATPRCCSPGSTTPGS